MKFNTKVLLSVALMGGVAFGVSAQEHLKSLNPGYIDPNTPAKVDFYKHVNKGWMDANPLTPEHARYGQFNILNDSSEMRVKNIVLGLAATKPARGTVAQKVSTLYEQAMDSTRRNQLGNQPLQAGLKKIESAKPADMEDLFLWMQKYYSSPFLNAGPMENMANSKEYAMYVSGAGLGLGDRDYYLKNDKRNKEIREAYKKLIVTQMMNAGYSKKDANRVMKNVMKYETLMADSTWTREESRNLPAMYNPRTIAQVKQLYPDLPWDRFFVETMGIDTPETVIVTELNTVKQGNNLFKTLTDREKKDLYAWQFVRNGAPYLSDAFSAGNAPSPLPKALLARLSANSMSPNTSRPKARNT